MPLNGAQISNGPTISVTGGTAITLSVDGRRIKDGINIVDASVADFKTRPRIEFTSKLPGTDPVTGDLTKWNKSINVVHPKVLASGKTEYPSIKILIKDHPENTAAEHQKLIEWAIQTLSDADFASFRTAGTLL